MPENSTVGTGQTIKADENLKSKMEAMQKEEDEIFMADYKDVSLDDLISKGYISHQVELAPGIKIRMRTLKKREELDVKSRISSYDGAQMFVVDQINTDTLAYSIVDINGIPMPGPMPEKFNEVKDKLLDLSDALLVAAMEEYRSLNKALVILAKGSSKNSLARHLLGRESA